MLNSKKSQAVFFFIMFAIIISIVAFVMTQPLKESIDINMNASNLNCTNPNISDVRNATCVLVDLSLPYFIGIIISVGLGLIIGKKDLSGVFVSVAIFLVTIILVSPLKALITFVRASDYLDCGNPAISLGAKLLCIIIDVWLFWLIAYCLAAGITFLVSKEKKP